MDVFDHEGPWTEAAYLALPHDGRVEVVDGTLLVGPGAGPRRTRVIERVREAVAAALPDSLRVRGPVPLRLGPDCVLVPDLVVTAAAPAPTGADTAGDAEDPPESEPAAADGETPGDTPDERVEDAADESDGSAESDEADEADEADDDAAILDAAAALMVIEVVGCDHGATDRSFKPQLYARSRIPYSVLIDHDGPFAVADMIIGGRYHEYARGGERLQLEEPFSLDIDLAALTAAEPAPATPAEPEVPMPAEASSS